MITCGRRAYPARAGAPPSDRWSARGATDRRHLERRRRRDRQRIEPHTLVNKRRRLDLREQVERVAAGGSIGAEAYQDAGARSMSGTGATPLAKPQ